MNLGIAMIMMKHSKRYLMAFRSRLIRHMNKRLSHLN